jgi:hypothetical protein
MRRKEPNRKKEVARITVLLIEQQGLDNSAPIVQQMLESSSAFTFQIERDPLKRTSNNTIPQLILLLLSGSESDEKTL